MMGEGQTSRDDLILQHLPQVHHIAQAILARLPAHAEIDDLLGAGALGLLDAVEKFDPSRSVKFRTYAELRIRGAILDSLRDLDWAPRSLRKKSREIANLCKELEQNLGRPPADTELAEAMNGAAAGDVAVVVGGRAASPELAKQIGAKHVDGPLHAAVERLRALA